jgi:hypothetical protein
MTSDVINVPDFVTMTTPDKPLAELAAALVAMFTEDDTLPQPPYLSISASAQEIDMQFSGQPDTFHTMARWAARFGGTVTGSHTDIDGKPAIHCELEFIYADVHIRAYAYVRTSTAR